MISVPTEKGKAMAACKDCIYFPKCDEYPFDESGCKDFKDRSRFVEIPCKVGDYVYYIKGGYYKEPEFCKVSSPCKIVEVSFKLQRSSGHVMCGFITDNGTRYSFNGIGKTVFLSREEAEKALEERSKQ